MTDKHIIDGVNVSGCKHFKIGTCLADYLLTDMNFSEAKCELCKDCYYKQLKRKEQTLDKIKDIVENKCLGCANFCNDCNIRFCVIKQILQVIRESEIKHES